MVHDEPWQVFAENGEPIAGLAKEREEFTDGSIMGAAHVWLWRTVSGKVEVLLQKRAMTKVSWPGYYDISCAGHIDGGESPVQSAVREGKEELNINVDAGQLKFIFSLRTPLAKNEIDHVYLYELKDDSMIHFADGEVETIEWVELNDLLERMKNPDRYNLLNQGGAYFSVLALHLKNL